MTADPQIRKKEKFEITLPSERSRDWSTLAHIVLVKKESLARTLEEVFGVTFEAPASKDHVGQPITKITFWGQADSEEKIMKTLQVLMDDFKERKYFSKMAVADIARQIDETGTFVRAAFNKQAANNNNLPSKKPVIEATENQKGLEKAIDENKLTFAIGPAGTGKTYVAMKKAIEALKSGKVKTILLARPAQETGKSLGFLPGNQIEKLDPYMRPFYDELDEAFGKGKYKQMIENHTIELVPIGFMRGRTFRDAFIIIDEAQNLTDEEVIMAATRIGFGSQMVITGDPNQIDLSPKSLSGLMGFARDMQGEPGVGRQDFSEDDCVRSEIAQTIINALKRKRPPAPEKSLENEKYAPVTKNPKLG